MSEKLKPCPFCGKSDSVILADRMTIYEFEDGEVQDLLGLHPEIVEDPYLHLYYVGCSKKRGGCGAHLISDNNKEKIIQEWNTRTQ